MIWPSLSHLYGPPNPTSVFCDNKFFFCYRKRFSKKKHLNSRRPCDYFLELVKLVICRTLGVKLYRDVSKNYSNWYYQQQINFKKWLNVIARFYNFFFFYESNTIYRIYQIWNYCAIPSRPLRWTPWLTKSLLVLFYEFH